MSAAVESNGSAGSRIILKSRYVRAYKNANGNTGKYAAYIATREGCVKVTDSLRNDPASEAQKKMIQDILKRVPESSRLMSLYEYNKNPTLGNASDFINDALVEYTQQIEGLEGYAQYIAERPMADKTRNNGLFSDGNEPVDLKAVQKELAAYQGNVWLPIISLRPEDSVGLGYDNPVKWHDLIERHLDDFAREYRIPRKRLRWVGAFHKAVNKDGYAHDHVHLMLWSTDSKDGHQSKVTGNNIRRVLAEDIFHEELHQLYEMKTETRDQVRERAQAVISQVISDVKDHPGLSSNVIQRQMYLLADRLKNQKGRKVYGFLPPETKMLVDGIMNTLPEADERIKDLLEAWGVSKDKQVKIYSNGKYVMPPLSEVKEFYPIKNSIIKEALVLNGVSLKGNENNKMTGVIKENRHAERSTQSDTRIVLALADLCQKKAGRPSVSTDEEFTNDDKEQLKKIGMSM